ncbi:hypothetical protein P7E02_19415 [Enterococcus hulanensis]|uniref:hypothetical protein n=1 Tax=Enterococcus hulanensis TaxID=2559929 RepID=UPI0028925FE2|nr:hypothetical protein [Enterococcus hulanensis]MDT2662058.1 hypothetical protein [Enterococcus hulanensis]
MGEVLLNQEIDNESVYSETIAQNLLENSWWTSETSNWTVNSGSVGVEEDESGFMNLTMDSNASCQVNQRVALKPNRCYFVMFDVQVTRYVKGLFGVHFNGNFKSGNPDLGLRRLSQGYETIIGTIQTPETWIHPQLVFAGSIHQADGAGSIRRLSLYDLTELYGKGKEPEANEFYSIMPNQQDEFGVYLSIREAFTSLDRKIRQCQNSVYATDKEAEQVFLFEMQNKTELIGMDNTTLKNINGFYADGHLSTSRDLLKLGLHATGYKKILSIWAKKKHRAFVHGKNFREIEVEATVEDEFLEKTYTILGGKSGALGNNVLNSLALLTDDEGELYLATVMGSSGKTGKTDRYEAMKLLVDTAKQRKTNPTYQPAELFKAKSGSIIVMPKGDPHFFTYSPPESLYSVNETECIPPASVTKLINALVVLDNITNLHETFEIKESDILKGSGPILYEGDIISFWDAFHFLFLPSANTIAKAFSRVVGHKIIQARGYVE